MGVVISSSHVVSATASSSRGGFFTLFPCSSTRSLSRETVLHKLLQRESFPQGAVLQEQAAPVWVPMGSQALPANPIQRGLLSPVICRSWQAPHGVTASFRPPPAPAWGPFQGLHMDTCSSMDLHGLQQDHLPHHGLHHALQGKTLCSSVSSTSSPSFFTDLGVCRVVSLT